MRLRPTLCKTLLSGLLLFAVNACAGEDQDSLDWLKVVAFAAHQTDYSGVYVYQYDNRVETSRITHVVEPDGEYEKIESLDGPKREIIRHHGQIWCCISHKMVQVDSQQGRSRFPALLPEQLVALSENYQVKDAGLERVAGYNTQVILFQPKDNLRYIYKIWAHEGRRAGRKKSVDRTICLCPIANRRKHRPLLDCGITRIAGNSQEWYSHKQRLGSGCVASRLQKNQGVSAPDARQACSRDANCVL